METRTLLAFTLTVCMATSQAAAQWACVTLKSFGNPDQSALRPMAKVLRASNGVLYGTSGYGGIKSRGTIYRVNQDGSDYRVVHHFGLFDGDGLHPITPLIEASDGYLYGTTFDGGTNFGGAIFRMRPDSTGYQVVYSFPKFANDYAPLPTALMEGSDAWLYGATANGIIKNNGLVFKLRKNGADFIVLHEFTNTHSTTIGPSTVIEGRDGALYGTTYGAYMGDSLGTNGMVYRIQRDGTGFTILHEFTGINGDGRNPVDDLIEGHNGRLYGLTANGGNANAGTFFSLQPDGSDYQVLYHFGETADDGRNPYRGFHQDADGFLYAVTRMGGVDNVGTVFRVQTNGSGYVRLYDFAKATDPSVYPSALIAGTNGLLYGTTSSQLSVEANDMRLYRLSKTGSDYAELIRFRSTGGEAVRPSYRLIQGSDAALYGTLAEGGVRGAVFKINADGTDFRQLHVFRETNAQDGATPNSDLLRATDGALYGTTLIGGRNGIGTLYTLAEDGSDYRIVHHFSSGTNTGGNPVGPLLEASNGYLYGCRSGGVFNHGVLYRMDTAGSQYVVLHHFNRNAGDGTPTLGPIEASDGMLYGVTGAGGSADRGTIFRISKEGSHYAVIYHFGTVPGDGQAPKGRLFEAQDGRLYGTTYGDSSRIPGTIFRLNRDGSNFAVLYTFNATPNDGLSPRGQLAKGPDGHLYGITEHGGTANRGTVFRIHPDGTGYAKLYDFQNKLSDGKNPLAGLTLADDGFFYGTASREGPIGGTLFRFVRLPVLQWQRHSVTVSLSWSNAVLQSCTEISGPWLRLTNAPNPFTIELDSSSTRFFRLQQ